MSESEFGRGYTTCLRQFTFHRARLDEYLDDYRELGKDNPDLYRETDAIDMWADGASDHLYELTRPPSMKALEWRRAEALQARALDIGHGFRESSKADKAEAAALLDIADDLLLAMERRGHAVESLEDCLRTDERIGLQPDKGTWSCSEDISRRRRVVTASTSSQQRSSFVPRVGSAAGTSRRER